MPKKVLITGGAGFVGSHALRHIMVNTDWDVVLPVTFKHMGVPSRIASALYGTDPSRQKILKIDLSSPIDPYTRNYIGEIDYILNFASDSHVDRSIKHPEVFSRNNFDIMLTVMEYARVVKPEMVIHISTDEVYGPAPDGYAHKEWDTLLPSNPYSASKAAQEAIGIAYWRTYGVPLVITNTMNMIGEMQDPEKYVPMVIQKVLRGETVNVHASPEGRIGSRFYLHARNLADACVFLLNRGTPAMFEDGADRPDKWHIVGEQEIDNLSLAKAISEEIHRLIPDAPELSVNLVDFHTSRPGHDLRYALDGSKLEEAGWVAPVSFGESLVRTVKWTLDNRLWWHF